MQSTVTIRDYPCGSGKTTSMIEGFLSDPVDLSKHEAEKFVTTSITM